MAEFPDISESSWSAESWGDARVVVEVEPGAGLGQQGREENGKPSWGQAGAGRASAIVWLFFGASIEVCLGKESEVAHPLGARFPLDSSHAPPQLHPCPPACLPAWVPCASCRTHTTNRGRCLLLPWSDEWVPAPAACDAGERSWLGLGKVSCRACASSSSLVHCGARPTRTRIQFHPSIPSIPAREGGWGNGNEGRGGGEARRRRGGRGGEERQQHQRDKTGVGPESADFFWFLLFGDVIFEGVVPPSLSVPGLWVKCM